MCPTGPVCIRCRESPAPQPLGLCAPCALHTRIELTDGLRRLGAYLDFERFLRERGID